MNQKGFAPILILLILAGVLIVGGIWYYEAHQPTPSQSQNNIGQSASASTSTRNTQSSSVTTTSTTSTPISAVSALTPTPPNTSSSSWINLRVNGSHGPVSLGLGSDVRLTWTSQNVIGCQPGDNWWLGSARDDALLRPFPSSSSITTTWPGGFPYDVGTSSYQIVCTGTSGGIVSDTVQVSPVPLMLTLTPNPAIANPYPVSSSGKRILLNSFEAQSGANGMYVITIAVQESQDIVSGALPVAPDSLSIQVMVGGSTASTWFTLEPATQYFADGWYDINGFVWIPGNSTATINIFGDIAHAQAGTYVAPFTIKTLAAGESSNSAIDRRFPLLDGTSPGVFQYPLPSWNPEHAYPISGQDIIVQ